MRCRVAATSPPSNTPTTTCSALSSGYAQRCTSTPQPTALSVPDKSRPRPTPRSPPASAGAPSRYSAAPPFHARSSAAKPQPPNVRPASTWIRQLHPRCRSRPPTRSRHPGSLPRQPARRAQRPSHAKLNSAEARQANVTPARKTRRRCHVGPAVQIGSPSAPPNPARRRSLLRHSSEFTHSWRRRRKSDKQIH